MLNKMYPKIANVRKYHTNLQREYPFNLNDIWV